MKTVFINFISIFLLGNIMSSVHINDMGTALTIAIALTLLNAIVKPILKLFLFPLNFMTLGLFSFVINAIVLSMAFNFSSGTIDSLGSAIVMSILIGVINGFLTDKK